MPNFFEEHKKHLLYAACALIVLGAGWQIYKATIKPVATKVIPVVRTTTVGALDPANTSVYPGSVHGRYESNLAFQVGGKINARLVNLGDKVHAGQVLMTIDPKDVAQSAEANNAALAAAISNQKLAETNANRYRQLYAQGATSKAVLDSYNTQLDAANATLRQAQAQAKVSGNQLEYTELKSDADGVVAALTGEVGMVTAAGAVMATVVRDGEREVQISVPENALGKLKIGQPATINFWALDNTTSQGHVRDIASMADTLTKTYRVNVAIDNMPANAQLGMTAKVSFNNTPASSAAFVLPASAIYKVNDKTQVWLVKDKHVKLTDVTVANFTGNDVLIATGLKAGDVVVTAGLSKLVDNAEVRLLEENNNATAQQNTTKNTQGSDKK